MCDLALAPRLSVATESAGTVLTPSQMSEIADHVMEIPEMKDFPAVFPEKGVPHCLSGDCQLIEDEEHLRGFSATFSLLPYLMRRCILVSTVGRQPPTP